MRDLSPEELDARLRAAPLPRVPPAVEKRLAERIARAQRMATQRQRQIAISDKYVSPRVEQLPRASQNRLPTRKSVPSFTGAFFVILMLLALLLYHYIQHETAQTVAHSNTPTPTGITTNALLDATFNSTDGLYSFNYNQEGWSQEAATDPDFPSGTGFTDLQDEHFFTLPATQEYPSSDYPTVMTTFWHTVTDIYTGSGLEIAPFTSEPDVTVEGNTWAVGSSYAYGGANSPVTYYALLHDGKTFFITTFSGIKTTEFSYFQPMLDSFKFLK